MGALESVVDFDVGRYAGKECRVKGVQEEVSVDEVGGACKKVMSSCGDRRWTRETDLQRRRIRSLVRDDHGVVSWVEPDIP